MPLNQVSNISVMDARTLSIQPWEKNMLQPIEKAIIAANIGINPQNDGNIIRLFLPPLTEERRKELVKKCQAKANIQKWPSGIFAGMRLNILKNFRKTV